MIENWMPVLDYEGLYEVSDLGRVKSLEKIRETGNYKGIRIYPEKIMNGCISDRYVHVRLSRNGKTKTHKVHRLVWEAFNGKTKLQIDHIIEGDKTDNRLCNLQAITNRENTSKYHSTVNTSSKYVGVNYDKSRSKWVAEIQVNGKKKFLGRFINEIDAHNAYQNALLSIKHIAELPNN